MFVGFHSVRRMRANTYTLFACGIDQSHLHHHDYPYLVVVDRHFLIYTTSEHCARPHSHATDRGEVKEYGKTEASKVGVWL